VGAGPAAGGDAAAASSATAQHVAAVLLTAPGLPSALPPPARASLAALPHLRPCLAALRRLCDPALGCAPGPAPEGPARGGAAGGAAGGAMGASGGGGAPRLTWSDCVWALGNVLTLVVGECAMRVVRMPSQPVVICCCWSVPLLLSAQRLADTGHPGASVGINSRRVLSCDTIFIPLSTAVGGRVMRAVSVTRHSRTMNLHHDLTAQHARVRGARWPRRCDAAVDARRRAPAGARRA